MAVSIDTNDFPSLHKNCFFPLINITVMSQVCATYLKRCSVVSLIQQCLHCLSTQSIQKLWPTIATLATAGANPLVVFLGTLLQLRTTAVEFCYCMCELFDKDKCMVFIFYAN